VQPFRDTNVRSGPSVTYDVIDVLLQGQTVEATGRSDVFSNWLQVNLGARRGWVAYFTVAVDGDISTLPIIQASAPTPTPLPDDIPPTQQASSNLYVTAYRRVNVRSGPGTEFEVLGALAAGQTADVIGTSGEANEWLEIRFNGDTGWVAYFVVTVSGDLASITSNSPDEAEELDLPDEIDISDLKLNQVIIITRFNTNLREQPVLGANVVDTIPYETTLQALARTEDNRWLQVRYGDETGWLITSLVNMGVSDIEALPVAAPAPEPLVANP
jgi:uncharacterized protein YraI